MESGAVRQRFRAASDHPARVSARIRWIFASISRAACIETGAGKQGHSRRAGSAFVYQMEGAARLTGSIDRKKISLEGHAFSETFRLQPPNKFSTELANVG
jgi:hypothetical protein